MDKDKSIFKVLIGIFIFAVFLAGCAGNNSANNASTAGTGVVSTVTVADSIETSGNLGADKLAALNWGTSGIIDKVNVVVGQKVKQGDILASLRLDSVPAEVATGQSDLATAQRDLQDILDSNTSLAQAQLDVITAQKTVEEAQNTFDGMAFPRASDALIKNTQAKIWDAQKRLTIANKQYKEQQNDPDGDPEKTAALLELTNAQLALNDLTATYNWYTGKPTQEDYNKAKAQLDVARAALDDARRKRDNVKGGADPLKVSAAKAKVTAAQATVNTMYIIAPFDGEVLSVQSVVGNAVSKDDSGAEMVDRSTLKVETLVDETAISRVTVGNPAEVSMDSLAGVTLKGKVARINRIGSTINGLVKYTVVVSVEPTTKPVLFGAVANVTITTGAPHSTLAVPVAAVFSDARGEYVLVISTDGNSTNRVTVQSGDLSGNLVTITTKGNLKAGDQVELGSGNSSSSGAGGNGGFGGGGGGGFRGPVIGGGGG
jgi:HlyD family secretion protein